MTDKPTDFQRLLVTLSDASVRFIVVGGMAAIIHGSARTTFDLDVVYDRSGDNVQRLVAALAELKPYLRGAPPGLPFSFDAATISRGLNFTLETTAGDIDILGEVSGGGTYDALLSETIDVELFGHQCHCVTLRKLLQLKRAAGRRKDLESIAELEALLEERERRG